MTVFTCNDDWGSMLTCIYDAWASRLGHRNIRLEVEPVGQISMFDTYVHVDYDEGKANSVIDAIVHKISGYFYSMIAYPYGACEVDTLDTIYRMVVLGFKYGPAALDMYQYREVARFKEISIRYGREANSFFEFVRFHLVGDRVYIAHIEPKSHVMIPVAEHFKDRMPSEYWIIVDDVHREAVVHPINEPFYLVKLTDDEFEKLTVTESYNDSFTRLWQNYFNAIAIEERKNRRCQMNHFPVWKRAHAVEFHQQT